MLRLFIENFKAIESLGLDLGRVNLFIGENGCGKSTVLEALGMAAAAANLSLTSSALKDRGIRVTDPNWMRSAFREGMRTALIRLAVQENSAHFFAFLTHDDTPYGVWQNQVPSQLGGTLTISDDKLNEFLSSFSSVSDDARADFAKAANLPDFPASVEERESAKQWVAAAWMRFGAEELHLARFLTYAPREDVLRDLARDSDVEPIGIHGEGLFKLLQVLDSEGQLPLVKEQLALLGWFDDLSVASGLNPSSRALQIRDVFIEGDAPFDQRSANEGFLFVLLYACLLISKYTPRFFAVDNVDTALNPKLCARTVKMFAELTKTYDRRVLLTAHNPGALDGLDLNDEEQRLFVVYRNTEGRTRARRILPADLPAGGEPLRLSEAFLRGYLGALPTNF